MRGTVWLASLPWILAAQDPTPLIQDLRRALQADSLVAASGIADKLDDAVRAQYSASLMRDSRHRATEALTWLPADIESFWVNQQPFVIKPEETRELLYARPAQVYSLDRLMALNDGEFYRALGKQTVKLVVAAAKNIREGSMGIPGPVAAQDVVYFYFFERPIDLPAPTDSIDGRPVWRAVAQVDTGAPFQPGLKREQREDENWLVLAKPDLLMLTNRRDLLNPILAQMKGAGEVRALPDDLPVWAQVDQSASFWGLRNAATVRFDAAKQGLEIRYLGVALPTRGDWSGPGFEREFKIEQVDRGVWRLTSDLQARGPWPMHFAMTILGFGVYR